jgi:hypothetical protein
MSAGARGLSVLLALLPLLATGEARAAASAVERYALVGRAHGDVVVTEWIERLGDGYRMVETGYGGVKMKTLDVRVAADGAIDSMYACLYNPFRPGAAPTVVELRRIGSTLRTRERKPGSKGGTAEWTVTERTLEPGTRLASLSPAGVEWWLRGEPPGDRARRDFRVVDPLMGERGVTIEPMGPADVRVATEGSSEDYRIDGDGRILSGSSDFGIEFTREAWVDPARRRVTTGRPRGR